MGERRKRRAGRVLAGLVGAGLVPATMVLAPAANAAMMIGHYNLIIEGRYDFHTWIWTIASCNPPDGVTECAVVSAIPQPIAKAYEWYGQAQRVGGSYTMTVDVPDGLRCGDVYYGPIIPTRDVYTWDAATLTGTLQSSFAVGCDNAPGGTFTYPFSLVRL
jgi:hypothetical protein